MAMLSIIRRWRLRENSSLRKTAERLSISRNTVRGYLRNQDLVSQCTQRKTPSKLDGLAATLSQ
jgi:transcriptional regulator with XRE-family HTH domain